MPEPTTVTPTAEAGNPGETGGTNVPTPPGFTTFGQAVKSMMTAEPPAAEPPAVPEGQQQQPPAGQTEPGQQQQPPEDFPANISQAKAEHWNRLKGDRDTWKTKASEYEKQLAEYNEKLKKFESFNPDELTKKLEMTAKERDDMLARIERVNIEQSPRFQQAFNAKFERITKAITDAAGKDSELALAVARAPQGEWKEKTLEGLLEGIESRARQLRLVALMNEYDTVNAERNQVLENSRSEHAKLVEQEKLEAAERQRQAQLKRETRVTEAVKSVATKYEGLKDEASTTQYKKILSGDQSIDWGTFAETVAKGLDHARLDTTLQAVIKERDELKKTIENLTKSNPNLRGGGQSSGSAGQQPTTFKDKVKQVLAQGVQ